MTTTIAPFFQPCEDWHTAGEPFRIVSHLPPNSLTPSLKVSQQRLEIIETPNHPLDVLRRTLCLEPRGHADMYGCFVTPPDDGGAHFGVLFWHKDGFSTACGHGSIALGYWAIQHGLVERAEEGEGEVDVVIDVPSGRVVARVGFDGEGKVEGVEFVNVRSYLIEAGREVEVDFAGKTQRLKVDLAFGGAVYISVDVALLGVGIVPANHQTFIDLSRQIRARFPDYLHEGLYDIYGVIFFSALEDTPSAITQRNVVVFADGQVDRSPCGSGTCARLAVLLAQGRLNGGKKKKLVHESIIGTRFEASLASEAPGYGSFPGCIPSVKGEARLVGRMEFWIDETDPVYPGFVFR